MNSIKNQIKTRQWLKLIKDLLTGMPKKTQTNGWLKIENVTKFHAPDVDFVTLYIFFLWNQL